MMTVILPLSFASSSCEENDAPIEEEKGNTPSPSPIEPGNTQDAPNNDWKQKGKGKELSGDYDGAKQIYLQAINDDAQAGDAMFCLGELYDKLKDSFSAFEWYKKSADNNNKEAFYIVADRYYNGIGTNKNLNNAKEWFSKSAQAGSAAAMYQLGIMYENGQGCTMSPQTAYEYYKKAADCSYIEGICAVGRCYEEGVGVSQSYNVAMDWYRKASNADNVYATYKIGEFYENGYGCSMDLNEAIAKYQSASEKGNAEASNKLGEYYEKGIIVPQDPNKAFEHYKKAVDVGHQPAINNIARCYLYGIGCNVDLEEAQRYLGQIKDPQDSQTHFLWCEYYFFNNDIDKAWKMYDQLFYVNSVIKATRDHYIRIGDITMLRYGQQVDASWYRSAIEEGSIEAIDRMGCAFAKDSQEYPPVNEFMSEGDVVIVPNLDSAIYYFEKAITHNDYLAMVHLGFWYEKGYGVEKDVNKAINYYKTAYDHGCVRAAYCLYKCYKYGIGVVANSEQANKYLQKGLSMGDVYCKLEMGYSLTKSEEVIYSIDEYVMNEKLWYNFNK